jgi:hypothetical protein
MSRPSPIERGERLQAALQQLEASRNALRHQLIPATEPEGGTGAGGPPRLADPLRRLWRRLRLVTRHSPVAALLSHAMQGWWRRHPWRPTGLLLAHQVQPVVRRHPLASAAAAALLGAALVGLRPWQWRAVDAQLRPLPGRLGHWLLAQLSSAPMQLALASLILMPRSDDAADDTTTAQQPNTPPSRQRPVPAASESTPAAAGP